PSVEYEATYGREGDFFEARQGSLEHWLSSRYCLYSVNRRGTIYRGEIDHPPWTLAPAVCVESVNTMVEPLGFSLQGSPHLMVAQPIDVRAWIVTRC
ncbi:DUF2071 domain-containing protein, partial [Rubripirellula amarantea]|nr:DUF2071 domain-containing protein [Rubripirellula amarantea]